MQFRYRNHYYYHYHHHHYYYYHHYLTILLSTITVIGTIIPFSLNSGRDGQAMGEIAWTSKHVLGGYYIGSAVHDVRNGWWLRYMFIS